MTGPRLKAIETGQAQYVVKLKDGNLRYGNRTWLDGFDGSDAAQDSELLAVCWPDGACDQFSWPH